VLEVYARRFYRIRTLGQVALQQPVDLCLGLQPVLERAAGTPAAHFVQLVGQLADQAFPIYSGGRGRLWGGTEGGLMIVHGRPAV
jgi:hypothetical protein